MTDSTPADRADRAGSGTRRRMHLHLLTLAFSGPNAHLERPFLDHYWQGALAQVRIALVSGAIFYGAFAILDHVMLPQHEHVTWLIRCAVVSAILGTSAFTYRPSFGRAMQPLFSALIVVGAVGITGMIVLGPPPVRDQYYAGIILILIYSYTFIRARFLWATATGWIVVLLYVLAAARLTDMSSSVLVSNSFFLVSANIAGMATCYAMEFHTRQGFYLVHLLDQEREKVMVANAQLESKVDERTAALQQINRQLQDEIAERRRTEQERTRLQQQLKQAEKLETIGKLAAGVAHDLNNILAGLVGYPELLLLDLPEDSPMRDSLLTIQHSGTRAAAVVQDLLALSRQGVVEKKRVNLNPIIEEYLQSPEYRRLLSACPHVRVKVDLQGDLLDVNASPVHVSKLVMNLVTNAFEANLVAGTVKISTRNGYLDRPVDMFERLPEGDYAIVTVADTGVGIAAEDLRKIFEPFFTKKKLGRSGTGLGMTLVWSTLKDHGGFIDIQSTEGVGTTFESYFPAARHGTMEIELPFKLEDYRGAESVLVVDDVLEQRMVATMMLRKLGYDVVAVASGEDALEFLKSRTVDILVLDMIMEPGIDGCETYRRIVEARPGQKAIIASGFSESERVREAQRLGAGAYVRKPYTLERLTRAIRSELA